MVFYQLGAGEKKSTQLWGGHERENAEKKRLVEGEARRGKGWHGR